MLVPLRLRCPMQTSCKVCRVEDPACRPSSCIYRNDLYPGSTLLVKETLPTKADEAPVTRKMCSYYLREARKHACVRTRDI